MTTPPDVSVVIPTYNRRDRVRRAVGALMEQRLDVPFEIVVVSDGSTDGTEAMLAALGGCLRIVCQANGGPAAARNRGVDEASGELIVFLDDDVVAADGLLQAHVNAHREMGDDVVVVGPMLDPPDFDMAPWVRWEQAMLRKQYAALDAGHYEATARQFYTGNVSLRRAHILAVGGFDTSFRRAEDVELAYRLDDLGLRFAYLRTAVGLHYAERSFDAWKSAAYAYGRNDVVFARDRGRLWIFKFMARKYQDHHPGLRVLVAGCIRWSALRPVVGYGFGALARVADRLRFERVVRGAYSVIYGVEYHVGVRDEIGGRDAFIALIRSGQTRTEGG